MKAKIVFSEDPNDQRVEIKLIPESEVDIALLKGFEKFPSKKTVLTERFVFESKDYGLRLETGSFGQDLLEFFAKRKLFDLTPFTSKKKSLLI